MSLPDDRQLEETFRAVLSAALGSTIHLRTTNENRNATGEPLPLPAVGIHARLTGENPIDAAAHNAELRLECRVDGTAPDSTQTLESLANAVRTAIDECDDTHFAEWDMVAAVEFTGTENGFEDSTRIRTLTFEMVVQRA